MTTASPPSAGTGPGLVRAIGRWDLTAAVVNGVVGSAVFSMPSTQAALTGSLSPLAYLAAGAGVLVMVLCFAEVSSRFTDAGGPYLYAREAFGPLVGFQAGWLTFWIRATALAANLNVFIEYLTPLWAGASGTGARIAVMGAVLGVITAVNLAGVRQATWTVDAFTVAKLLPLALLVGVGLPAVDGGVLRSQAVADPEWTQAILLLVFAYGGFEAPLIAAAEARDPRRDSAFALLVALAVIAVLYMSVQFVVIGLVPQVAGVKAPLAAAFATQMGAFGAVLASLTALVSIWGYATGTVLQSPRVLFAMAERGELPGVLGTVHARFRTPHAAILAYAAVVMALAAYGSFQWNATLSAIVRLVTYGLTCAALPVLRARRDAPPPGFRVAGGPLVSALAVLFCAWLLTTRSFAQAWLLVAIVVAGFLIRTAARAGAR